MQNNCDDLIPLPDVPIVLRQEYGRRVSRQTVWNWHRKGLSISSGSRVRLLALERGRRLYTTRQWIHWFMHEG